jgi:transcriptional regulator with XRE-family HTH domain
MELGNKILELRKQEKLSQEQLAEKMNVTRQTISKWELNETTPDIKQAKELSKIFKVSLDELTDNDISNIVVQKVSNTEKLAGLVLKVSKWLGICFLITLVIDIISFIIYMFLK